MSSQDLMSLTPVKAIRKMCLQCQSQSPKAVRLCEAVTCPLWEFRFGKNPHKKGLMVNLKPFGATTIKKEGIPTAIFESKREVKQLCKR